MWLRKDGEIYRTYVKGNRPDHAILYRTNSYCYSKDRFMDTK